MRRVALLVALLGGAAACAPSGPIPAADYGARLFADPSFSPSQFNVYSCATCHTKAAEVPGQLEVGRSLQDSAFRASWWGGYAPRLLDAVNDCYVFYMRGVALDPTDARGRALYEFLARISPDRPAPALPLTAVQTIADIARGDSERGRAVYDGLCRRCHGDLHSGIGRISTLASIIPEASIGFAEQYSAPLAEVVIEKVRHGSFFGIGGTMPFFSVEALDDADLGALLAFMGIP